MNFSELQILGEKLQANPPSFAVSPARELLLRQIDVLFGEADSEYSAALSKFYSARVDKILDEAAAYSGDTPRMWKFYSSGFIIKAAGKTNFFRIFAQNTATSSVESHCPYILTFRT